MSIITGSTSANITELISGASVTSEPAGRSSVATIASQFADKNRISTDSARRLNDLAEQVYDEQNAIDRNESDDMPALRKAQQKSADSAGRLLLQNAQFIHLTNKLSENVLAQALSELSSVLAARKKEADALSGALDEADKELSAAMDQLKSTSELLKDKVASVDELKSKLAALQQSLSGLEPDDPRYADIQRQIQQTTVSLNLASAEAAEAEADVLQQLDLSQALIAKHSALIQTAIDKSSNPDGKLVMNKELILDQQENHKNFLERMSELMGELIKVMGEASVIKLKNDRIQNEKRLEDIKATLMEKSKELIEQMAKAAEAAAKSACITKILGPLIMAIGVVTAMFGGVALMAIALGMIVADVVMEKMFGFSIGGLLMEKVFLPLMEVVKKATDFAINHMGLEKLIGEDVLEIVKNVVALVVTAVVVVVAAYLAKAAGKELYKAFGATIATTLSVAVTKAIDAVMKELPKVILRAMTAMKNIAKAGLKKLDDIIASALKKLSINPATVSGITTMMGELTAFVEAANRAVYGVIDGIHTKKSYQIQSELYFTEELNDLVKQSVERMAETFKANDDQMNNLSEQLSYLMQSGKETSQYMISRRPA